MNNAYTQFSTKGTPQTERAPGRSDQVKNNAGGYVFQVSPEMYFRRFLILGTAGGTYYASEKKLTREAAEGTVEFIKQRGKEAVDIIVEVSKEGLAPKNDPAIFALAMACSKDIGDKETRAYALSKLPEVCRIGTHLFHFLQYAEQFRGWGRGLREAVGSWYLNRKPEQVAYQVMKYQQRDGWSHRDALRLAHPKPPNDEYSHLFKYITTKEAVKGLPDIIGAATEALSDDVSAERAIKLIQQHGLTHEMISNKVKNDPKVWEALLEKMPITAAIRNLGKMTSVGLLKQMSSANKKVIEKVTNLEILKEGRVHPINILVALKTYAKGHGDKGSLSWNPVQQVVDALDDAFYLAFKTVEPTGRGLVLGIDISGSMDSPAPGLSSVSCREVAAAMAMVTARVERNYALIGFTCEMNNYCRRHANADPDSGVTELKISPRQRLDDVVQYMRGLPMGGTDCAQPILWATKHDIKADGFCTYTDCETWAGVIQPFQALKMYRDKTGIEAKNVVVGITATPFTTADPKDPNSLDVVGFDSSAPQVIGDFVRGKI